MSQASSEAKSSFRVVVPDDEQHVPRFRFGLIADVQYADLDDAPNFTKTRVRRYRHSLGILEKAVDYWSRIPDLKYIVQLGDLVDGFNKSVPISDKDKANGYAERRLAAMDTVLSSMTGLSARWLNAIGNHELYCFGYDELAKYLHTRDPVTKANYYAVEATRGLKFIVLNGYEISLLGRNPTDPEFVEACQLLAKNNPNLAPDPSHPRRGVDWSAGITGLESRFMPYNGACGDAQRRW